MNSSLEHYLIEHYPLMYRDYGMIKIRPGTPFSPMAFGFECGDGWFRIIRELSELIFSHLAKLEKSDDFYILQVKEKFGTLRYYASWEDQVISKYIQNAEKESAKTCETCGAKGKLYAQGWWVTLCPRHYKEWKNKS